MSSATSPSERPPPNEPTPLPAAGLGCSGARGASGVPGSPPGRTTGRSAADRCRASAVGPVGDTPDETGCNDGLNASSWARLRPGTVFDNRRSFIAASPRSAAGVRLAGGEGPAAVPGPAPREWLVTIVDGAIGELDEGGSASEASGEAGTAGGFAPDGSAGALAPAAVVVAPAPLAGGSAAACMAGAAPGAPPVGPPPAGGPSVEEVAPVVPGAAEGVAAGGPADDPGPDGVAPGDGPAPAGGDVTLAAAPEGALAAPSLTPGALPSPRPPIPGTELEPLITATTTADGLPATAREPDAADALPARTKKSKPSAAKATTREIRSWQGDTRLRIVEGKRSLILAITA
jgi:hypothetical protein